MSQTTIEQMEEINFKKRELENHDEYNAKKQKIDEKLFSDPNQPEEPQDDINHSIINNYDESESIEEEFPSQEEIVTPEKHNEVLVEDEQLLEIKNRIEVICERANILQSLTTEIMEDVTNFTNEFLENFTELVQKRTEKNETLIKEISETIESNEKQKQKIEKAALLSVNLNEKLEEISKM
eukprot:gene6504-10512_t